MIWALTPETSESDLHQTRAADLLKHPLAQIHWPYVTQATRHVTVVPHKGFSIYPLSDCRLYVSGQTAWYLLCDTYRTINETDANMKLDIISSAVIALAAIEQVAAMAVHAKRQDIYKIAINFDANMRIMGYWGKNGTDETRIYWIRYNSTSGPTSSAMYLPWNLQGAMTSLGFDYATMGSANVTSGAVSHFRSRFGLLLTDALLQCLIRPEPGKSIGNHTAFWLQGKELAGPTPVYQNQNNVDLYCQDGV